MTTVTNNTPMQSEVGVLEAPLAYAELGWPVYPVHPRVEGVCSGCGPGTDCEWAHERGHPAVPVPDDSLGFPAFGHIGTTDPPAVRALWERYPSALVGLSPGLGVVVVELSEPIETRSGKPLPWQRPWEFSESVPAVRDRFDYVLGPVGEAPYFVNDEDSLAYVLASPEPLGGWSLARTMVHAADLARVILLPSSLDAWETAPAVVECPERMTSAFGAEVSAEDGVVLALDRDSYEERAEQLSDVVQAVRAATADAGKPVAARKVAERLSGNRARKFERIREAALHPGCPVVGEDSSRGTPVYSIA